MLATVGFTPKWLELFNTAPLPFYWRGFEPTQGAPRLQGWLIVGRRGETERVDLELRWDADEEAVVDEGEDVTRLAAR